MPNIERLKSLFKTIYQKRSPHFSGISLLIYDSLTCLTPYFQSMYEHVACPANLTIDSPELISFLLDYNQVNNPFHDGFHFMNAEGLLTHLSQYLSPPLCKTLFSTPNLGSRHLTSLYSSQFKGVQFIGSLTAKGDIAIIQQGHHC